MAQSKPETVREVIIKTGIIDQLQAIDGLIAVKLDEKKSMFDKVEDFERFKVIMTSGMNSKNAQKYFEESLIKNSREDSLKMVISLFADPFVQEFNKLEKEASLPEKKPEMTAYFQSLSTTPPPQNRIQQLVALDKELKTSELTYKIFQNVILSMIKGGNAAMPAGKQMKDEEIKEALSKAVPANLDQILLNQTVAMSLFTYKNVTDENLNKYLEIYKTPAGKYCIAKFMDAFDYSFTQMGNATGNSLSTLEKK